MEIILEFRKNALRTWKAGGATFAVLALLLLLLQGRPSLTILLLAIFATCLLCLTFGAISGLGARDFRKYLETLAPEERETLDREYGSAPRFGQAALTDSCLVRMTRHYLDAIPYGELVWAYLAGRTTGFGGHTYTVILVSADKKSRMVDIKTKDPGAVESFLKALRERNPGIFIGRTKENRERYRTDFAGMRAAARAGSRVPEAEETEMD